MIEINNLTSFAVDKKFFVRVAKKVLKGENRGIENISIAFVSPAEIKKLNQKYRKKHKPTDVLSFGRALGPKSDSSEVVICPEVVKNNAKEFSTTFKKELTKMLIHGLLHILGYEHEGPEKMALEMAKKQEKYLSKFKF
ncbi:MAG: rRNA maturation RNase YbeY [Candidatus Staskawiczbacteria bacterium]|nr:rRNA maturation RNase YbeY [Candidatus Staskawiczbacteria bacterium]MBI3337282.1 rRNA maturation RNase YbeY [Candidatus Staskawiczbacteria bacterium]